MILIKTGRNKRRKNSKMPNTEQEIQERINKPGTYLASFSDLKYTIKRIVLVNAKWETDECPKCHILLEKSEAMLSKAPILECPECGQEYRKAEKVIEKIKIKKPIDAGFVEPICPKPECQGIVEPISNSGIAYARCTECKQQYDAGQLLAGWLKRGWIEQPFCKKIIKTIIRAMKEKREDTN
jgi:DNA-directed RNA polymerase subunit M/transcription elongation factor TFIIS